MSSTKQNSKSGGAGFFLSIFYFMPFRSDCPFEHILSLLRMRKKCSYTLVFIGLLLHGNAISQALTFVKGAYLVSLSPGIDIPAFYDESGKKLQSSKVADMMNIWLVQIPDKPAPEALVFLRRQPGVRNAQLNHIVEQRTHLEAIPNDPLFEKQWHLLNDGSTGGLADADLDAELAWDLSTGGLTAAGDTIVLAVIDGGIDADHPDLMSRLWHNWLEIPDNGLDDDQNGFIDDHRGWNVFSDNDDIEGVITTHGTPVSGLLGAAGNNGLGVSGVNWNSQMMFVSAPGTEAEILAAYDYVWKMRTLYNDTDGEKGAFVVAVNCSWGINFGQPAESPLWCEAFDILGEAGILSVAATANLPVNVDEAGDLPTTCPSIYLLSVTSLNRWDNKAENAAWGPENVDIGAYGHEVFSTATGNNYSVFSGTSFAAPQVTGAVGLLYAMDCPNLITTAKTNPSGAAYWSKSMILDAHTPNEDMQDKTVSGGRLNLYQALDLYQGNCSDCPMPFALKILEGTDTSAMLGWIEPVNVGKVNLRWRRVGQSTWNMLQQVSEPFQLAGLWACTAYEFEMQSICSDSMVSGWSAPFVFETKGCCAAPAFIWTEQIGEETVTIAWPPDIFNNTFRIRLESVNGSGGQLIEADSNVWVFENLLPCTEYIVKVQTRCEDWLTAFSQPFSFKTKGCGACNEISYCSVNGISATQEWISSVQLGSWIHESGSGGNGYQNFSNSQIVAPVLVAHSTVPITITNGYFGTSSKHYYRVFIDYNQDGEFMDEVEQAYDPGFAFEGPASGQIIVPDFEQEGLTRMRVMMQYSTPNDPPPSPCEPFDFGQVEDYCIWLQKSSLSSENQHTFQGLKIFPVPATDWLLVEWPDGPGMQEDVTLRIMDIAGREVEASRVLPMDCRYKQHTALWHPGIYIMEIRSGKKCLVTKIIKQ
ncbi:MAG TPA: hypothetical protein DCF33_06720 [Saprospirales bacterium]|nr:hypothetical protein [Saprospirales bacterium]